MPGRKAPDLSARILLVGSVVIAAVAVVEPAEFPVATTLTLPSPASGKEFKIERVLVVLDVRLLYIIEELI
jgi:hypothetical protein